MSAPDDDGTEMNIRRSSPTLSEAEADALLSGRVREGNDDLREILGLMRTAASVPAPPPSAALASVLEDGFEPLPVTSAPHTSRWGRWSVRLGVATATAMTVTLGAATANALPAPLQTAVADVVGAVTPLRLPRPAAVPDSGSTDSGGPAGDRAPVGGAGDEEPAASITPKAPAFVDPPRRPGATDADPDENDELEADELEADDPDADEPETDEPETDEPGAGEPAGEQSETEAPDAPDSDQPDSTEADEIDAGYRELPEADEPELDVDAQPEQDDTERAD